MNLLNRLTFLFVLTTALLIGLTLPHDASASTNYSEDVIYQIVTDRFKDGNPENNPEGALYSENCENLTRYCGGDWQGITEQIENGYFTELGVSALWISPPFENVTGLHPDGHSSYHGYWARDFKRTNPFFWK